ncbi:MAG: DUF4988 and DUF4465 domain-containing protein [Tannerella sp.]|jgi:hypothetical protein|nr:DUF4988 and DUF4465 domain-containing protein [Tannerella sp.]
MKKLFTLFTIALLGAAMWNCSYDDDDLWNAVDELDGRVKALEQAAKDANTDIDALRKLVDELQKNVTVTSVDKTDDGYTITFSDGETATITNGKNGINAPAISVKKDTDNVYYWTLDGEWLLIDGKKVKAQGIDAVAPQLRINETTKIWEMSTDDGTNWTSMGVKAEGADGKNGDSMFASVSTTEKPGFAVFTLTAGGKIEIPMQDSLNIAISAKNVPFVFGEQVTFTLTSKGVEKLTWTKPDGWKVAVDGTTLTVTAPAQANSYAETEGVIALIGMAGNYSCMAELKVSVAEKHIYTVTFEGDDWTKWVACNYKPKAYATTKLGNLNDYTWVDAVTQLATGRPSGYGYPWIVSSYNSSSLDPKKYGYYEYDLYVYNPDGPEDATTGGGRNGSDNFLTNFGYFDFDFNWDMGRPILKFTDGKARMVKSLYVNSTCYFYSVATAGNALSPALTKDVTYYATGYDAGGNEIKTITMTFATPDAITKEWTKWDLSELGPIVSLRLNQAGGADNGYGYSLPAYYALDDITVEW